MPDNSSNKKSNVSADELREAIETLKKQRAEEKLEAEGEAQPHNEQLTEKQTKHAVSSSPVLKWLGRAKDWFITGKNKYKALAALVAVLVLAFIVPSSRYTLLNTLGVRASVEVYVVDEGTNLPLRNVAVRAGEVEKLTNKEGKAVLSGVKLGPQTVVIAKLAYADEEIEETVTTGNNEIGVIDLRPTGSQYQFVLSDWISGEFIEDGEVAYKENSVFSNEEGVALLTVPPVNEKTLELTFTAPGYVEKTIEIKSSIAAETNVDMVIDSRHFFISKRSGKYSLYRSYSDGQSEELVLKIEGSSGNIQLLTDENIRSVFLVSYSGERNSDGSLLFSLQKIDSETLDIDQIDESESIRLYGISAGRLIYVKIAAGQSGGSPERQQLISYDPQSGDKLVIAKTNYFNSVLLTNKAVYYAPSDLYKTEKKPYLFKADPLSAASITIHAGEVWSIFRTGISELTFDAKQDWYKVGIAAGSAPIPLNGRPAESRTILYTLNKDETEALWVDNRDGKGYLVSTNIKDDEDKTLHTQSGLRYPVRWLDDNHIVYRVYSSAESADYVIDTRGGDAQKIVDVTNVSSYERWYYYY